MMMLARKLTRFAALGLLVFAPLPARAEVGQTLDAIDQYPILNMRPGAILRLAPDQKCEASINVFVETSTPAFFQNPARSLWTLLRVNYQQLDIPFNCSAKTNSSVLVSFVVGKKVCATTTLRRVPDNGAVTGVHLSSDTPLALNGDCTTAAFPQRPEAVKRLVAKLWTSDPQALAALYRDPDFLNDLDRADDPELALSSAHSYKWPAIPERRATAADVVGRYRKVVEAGHPAAGFFAAREIFEQHRLAFELHGGKRPMDLLSEPLVLLARSVEARFIPAQIWWAQLKAVYPDLPFALALEQAKKSPISGATPVLVQAPAKTPNSQALDRALNAALLAHCNNPSAFFGNLQQGAGQAAILSLFASARPKDDWCEISAPGVSKAVRLRPPQTVECTATAEGQATCRFPVSFACKVDGATALSPQAQMQEAILCGPYQAIPPTIRSGRFSRNPDGSWRFLDFD